MQKIIINLNNNCYFKIVMHGISLQDALNLDNWSEGILVKKFYSVSHHTNSENAVLNYDNDNE